MRGVWRSAPAACRLLATGIVLGALALLLLPSSAFAQSGVGRAINTATGRSLEDANEQNQKDAMIGQGSGTTVGGTGGAIGAAVIPTGRLKKADHDELKGVDGEGNFAWDTREASVFANVVYVMPGMVMGGQVKVGVFGGQNWVSVKMKNGGDDILDVAQNQHGSALNESTLFGTSLLWANAKGMYAMANVVGFVGKTTMKDAIDNCAPPCTVQRYAYDTSGFTSAVTTGNVFKLSNSPTGPLLDLRGVAAYTQNIGDMFFASNGAEQKFKFSTWTLTGSATLFSNITLQNSALLRPYIQGYVRQEVAYDNKLKVNNPGGAPPFVGYVHFDQAHTYGGVDVGFTYELGKMTFGAATYYEASGDERTWGGRLGASWKLN